MAAAMISAVSFWVGMSAFRTIHLTAILPAGSRAPMIDVADLE
jgi:hypothetical protein